VTNNEKELVAALEADIEIWESLVRYVERSNRLARPAGLEPAAFCFEAIY
jgi:hypothetical protein